MFTAGSYNPVQEEDQRLSLALEAETASRNLKERLSGCIILSPVQDNSPSIAIGAALHFLIKEPHTATERVFDI